MKRQRSKATLDRSEYNREMNKRLMSVFKAKGLTQADVVRASGATSPTVTDWFNRGAVPDPITLGRLAKAIRVNGHWLLTGQGPKSLPGEGSSDELYSIGAQAVILELEKLLRALKLQFFGDETIAPDAAAIDAVKALERTKRQPQPRPVSQEVR